MEAVKEEEARVVALRAVEATPESFAPFGQVITATPDGDEFGPHDAQLDLSRGIPRRTHWAWANREASAFSAATAHVVEGRPPGPRALAMEGVRVVTLRAVEATPESFAPFGQVVAASGGKRFGPNDAQLDLSRGVPRFYIMRLEKRPLKFWMITHHASVTQCLGSIGGEDWYLGVAKPSIVEDGAHGQGGDGRKPVQSRAGHYYLPPDPAEVCIFRVSGAKFLKLHIGTWHAGPQFKADAVDFYNLELSNTNIVDHTTHDFKKDDGVTFVIED